MALPIITRFFVLFNVDLLKIFYLLEIFLAIMRSVVRKQQSFFRLVVEVVFNLNN